MGRYTKMEVRLGHNEVIEDYLIQAENEREDRECFMAKVIPEHNLNYAGRGLAEEDKGGGYSKQKQRYTRKQQHAVCRE